MHRFLLSSLLLSLLLFLLCQVNLDLVSMKSLQKMVLLAMKPPMQMNLISTSSTSYNKFARTTKPGGGGYSHTLPIWACVAQRGRDFKAPVRMGYPFQRRFLERGIMIRMHESSSFVSNHLKLFKVRLRLKIWFNTLCTLERSIKNWPIFRTGYQF